MKNSATQKELFETMNLLASNSSARKIAEDEINSKLSDGFEFHVNNCGFGEIYSKNIHMSCPTCNGHGGTYDINPNNGDIVGIPCENCS